MSQITAPVGPWEDSVVKKRGGNRKQDIVAIQKLLAAAAKKSNTAFDPGTPDGKIARVADRSSTLKAIFNFQKSFMAKPDRRVDANGSTLRKLTQTAGPTAVPNAAPITPGSTGVATVVMNNRGGRRNMAITQSLKKKLAQSVGAVFGSGAVVTVYSGGQPAKGSSADTGKNRTGSVRHDDGHAADITILVAAKKVGLDGMEKLGQWWLAKKCGCVGVGMQSGRGIHLDEWNSTTGPALSGKMGRYWTYGGAGPSTRGVLAKGASGQLPS